MAITVLIKGVPPTLPEGYCPPTWQDLANKLIGLSQFTLLVDVGNSFFNFGDSTPAPENRSFPWLRTVGGQIDRWYVYSNGFWLGKYTGPDASSDVRWGWVGTEVGLKTFDGGEDAAVDAYHGPFWEVDHDFDGRSPMAPGDVPTSTPAKNLAVGENYGEGSHILSIAEGSVTDHKHVFGSEQLIGNDDGRFLIGPSTTIPSQKSKKINGESGDPDYQSITTGDFVTSGPIDPATNTVSTGTPSVAHQTVHPVRGIFQIKRTARVFIRI